MIDISFLYEAHLVEVFQVILILAGIAAAGFVLFAATEGEPVAALIAGIIAIVCFVIVGILPDQDYLYMQGVLECVEESKGEYTKEDVEDIIRELRSIAEALKGTEAR